MEKKVFICDFNSYIKNLEKEGIKYDCSGFQTKTDEVIKKIDTILNEFFENFIHYCISNPSEKNYYDANYALDRIKNYLVEKEF